MLKTVVITPEQAEYARITALLPAIFPPEELASENMKIDAVPYLCFYEDAAFIGFAQVFKKPELHYLSYMAMLPQHRSKGYGGRMLDLILSERGNVPLALDIEVPDETAANAEQRIRRLNFYLKHGLVDSGYIYEFNGNPFMLMTTGEENAPAIMQKYCAAISRNKHGVIRIYKRNNME